jgi:putative peptidoglycan lipid II flippase
MLKILKQKNSVPFVMLLLLITKILGFLKLRTIAQLFGVSHELDIFWAAFTIPDMLFMLLVAGSINAAIIPTFSEIFRKEGKTSLNKFFNHLMVIISSLFILIALILFIFAPQLTRLLIESETLQDFLKFGQRIGTEDFELFVSLTRITMVSPILLGISSLVTGYLQVRKQFFVTSLAPLFYNLAMIIGSVVFVVGFDMGVEGIAISAVLGSLMHLLIQIPQFKKYYDSRLQFGLKTLLDGLKNNKTMQAVKLALPRTIAVLGEEVNTIVNTLISFSLAAGALSAYKFAVSLHLFPINIVGSAIAQVALPNLAESCDDEKKYCKVLNSSIQKALFLVLPIVSVLIVLRLPLVRLAYGVGAFDWRATILTAWCLVLLSFSVVGQSIVQILLRAFYALKETWLPLIAITVGIIVNIGFAILLTNFLSHYYDWRPIIEQMFIQVKDANGAGFAPVFGSFIKDSLRWSTTRGSSDLSVGGLSLSLSISYLVEMVVLSLLLNIRIKVITWKKTMIPSLKKVINASLMCLGMYFVFKLFDFQLDTTRTISIVILTIITTTYGFLSYFIGCKVFRIKEVTLLDEIAKDIKENLFRRRRRKVDVQESI